MFCRKCGTQIPDDSDFCFKCGARCVFEDENSSPSVDLSKPNIQTDSERISVTASRPVDLSKTDTDNSRKSDTYRDNAAVEPNVSKNSSYPYKLEEHGGTQAVSVQYSDAQRKAAAVNTYLPKCIKCGRYLNTSWEKCPYCGEANSDFSKDSIRVQRTSPSLTYCPNCEKIVHPTWKNCLYCGRSNPYYTESEPAARSQKEAAAEKSTNKASNNASTIVQNSSVQAGKSILSVNEPITCPKCNARLYSSALRVCPSCRENIGNDPFENIRNYSNNDYSTFEADYDALKRLISIITYIIVGIMVFLMIASGQAACTGFDEISMTDDAVGIYVGVIIGCFVLRGIILLIYKAAYKK